MNVRQLNITRTELLADTEWLRLFRLHYRTKSHMKRSWVMATRLPSPRCATGRFEKPDAVVIVAQHVRWPKIVVTREYRVALGDYEYGFPAGLVDAGETVAAAAHRELHEETGLKLIRLLRESPPVYSSAGMTDESVAMVYVECDGEPSAEASHDSELIDVLFVSPAEAGRLCSDASLKFDAKAWLVLSHFAATGRI
jgi:ADP-ribose pyrophosphatase